MAPPKASTQGSSQSDDGADVLLAIRAAQEKSAKVALDKKKASLKKLEPLATEYKKGAEAACAKHQEFVKNRVKEHKASEKKLLAEIELARSELAGLLGQQLEGAITLATAVQRESEKLVKDTSTIVREIEELHDSEQNAIEGREEFIWGAGEREDGKEQGGE